jgi:hypothetical protein
MPQGTATRKTVPVNYFHLAATGDLLPAMLALLNLGFDPSLKLAKQDTTTVALLTIDGPAPERQHITTSLGNVLVWENNRLLNLTLAQFQAGYSVP